MSTNINTNKSTGNLPEKKFRAGAISATVWRNVGTSKQTGDPTEYKTISLQRGYKDKNGQWQNTTSFRINDLPRLGLVLRQAYEFAVTNNSQNSQNSQENSMSVQEEPVM